MSGASLLSSRKTIAEFNFVPGGSPEEELCFLEHQLRHYWTVPVAFARADVLPYLFAVPCGALLFGASETNSVTAEPSIPLPIRGCCWIEAEPQPPAQNRKLPARLVALPEPTAVLRFA